MTAANRVRAGKFGIAVVGVDLTFHDKGDSTVRSFAFSNRQYALTNACSPMWSHTEVHKDSFKSFKEHYGVYCVLSFLLFDAVRTKSVNCRKVLFRSAVRRIQTFPQ